MGTTTQVKRGGNRRPTAATTAVVDLGPPQLDDHVTLYTYAQAAKYLKMHASTIRRHVNTGNIAERFITRIGGFSHTGRVFMSANQIVSLLRHWADAETPPLPVPPPLRQRKRTKLPKPPSQRDFLPSTDRRTRK